MLRFSAFIILLFTGHCVAAQTTFVMESLPAATPASDTIFVSGTFNDWHPADPAYALKRRLNGQLAITLPLQGAHEYKFTRGSWTKVETDRENKYIENRRHVFAGKETIYIRVENWLDLGGARNLNYLIFYFFAAGFQAFALCFLVFRIQKADRRKVNALIVTNAVLATLLMLAVLRETSNQIWQSYITFFFHIAFFCWGPLELFFTSAFFGGKRRAIPHYFLPALVVLIFTIARIAANGDSGVLGRLVSMLPQVNIFIISAAAAYTLYLKLKIGREFGFLRMVYSSLPDVRSSFIWYFFWLSTAGLAFIFINLALVVFGVSSPFIDDFHGGGIALSLLVFIETFFLWRYPEIMKEEKIPHPADDVREWVLKLNDLMVSQKPFRNVDLTVSDLAEMLGTKPHFLSRVINESFQKNFRDFVNSYRIEEFIALAGSKEFKHYTFLALAQEVGFNSKSTFNLAFKKYTNQTPREYFKKGVESTHDVDERS